MKIDNSWLQAGALIGVGGLGAYAAWAGQWQLVGACVTGFFAIINIHPKETPRDFDAGAPTPPPPPQT